MIRRIRRYHRVTGKLERLLVIGQTGYVTLEALGWLHDARAALIHLDAHGRLITTSTPAGVNLPALRRAQALAATAPAGIEITRWLLTAKVAGQQAVLAELPDSANASATMDLALSDLARASDLKAILLAESLAAEAYWETWAPLPLPFPAHDRDALPEHWQTFAQRRSLLISGPRNATNPAGAVLNYLYALIEAEVTLALHAVGLDPGLGTFHTDQRDRDSLSLDVMEPLRPLADAYLLALLTQRRLSARDFVETRQGGCRLHPRLASELAETLPAWRKHAGPVAEEVAHAFARQAPGPLPLLTPLTRRNQRDAWEERKPDRRVRQSPGTTLVLPASCRDCGTPLPDRRRRYCDQCRRELRTANVATGRDRAAAVLADLRAERRDPAHGGRAAQIRGTKNAAHQKAVREWTDEKPDLAVFRRNILPGIRQIPVPDLMAATGLGQHYCSLIRLGKTVPHPRHWETLQQLGQED